MSLNAISNFSIIMKIKHLSVSECIEISAAMPCLSAEESSRNRNPSTRMSTNASPAMMALPSQPPARSLASASRAARKVSWVVCSDESRLNETEGHFSACLPACLRKKACFVPKFTFGPKMFVQPRTSNFTV